MFLLTLPIKAAWVFAILYYNEYRDIVVFATELYIVTKLAVHLFAIGVPLLETKTYSKLYKRLHRAEQLIDSLNINQSQGVTKLRQYSCIVVTVVTVFCHSAALYVNRQYTLDICFGYFIVYATFFSYIHHITSLLAVVGHKLSLINWHLDYLSNRVPEYLAPPDDVAFIENKLYGEHTADMFVDADQDTRELSAFKVKRYNQIHFLLWSFCNIVGEYFSLQNFGCLLQTSLMVVKYCLFMFEARNDNLFGFLKTLNTVLTTYVWCVFLLAKQCNDIICESKRSALLVHQLLDEDSSDEVSKELEVFSKQAMSRKIQFTGFDFFDIDLKMITSLVCIVLPVCLFLVQYNYEQHKSEL